MIANDDNTTLHMNDRAVIMRATVHAPKCDIEFYLCVMTAFVPSVLHFDHAS